MKDEKEKRLKILKIRTIREFAENQIRSVMIFLSLSMLVFSGCGEDVSVLKDTTTDEKMEEISSNNSEDANVTEYQDTQEEGNYQEDSSKNNSKEDLIYVDLGGAVKHPGVYQLKKGSRVFEVIALAGGFTEDAYLRNINQAEIVLDGQQIYIYTVEEAKTLLEDGTEKGIELSGNLNSTHANVSTDKVNINFADKATLMTLNGIGSTRADAILQYRASHGRFKKIEDLMLVEGIKEKTYEKIKDCITVQ